MWIVLRAVSTLPPSTVRLPSASISPSTHLVCLCTFYSYIFAAIFVYIFVHQRLHSSVDAQDVYILHLPSSVDVQWSLQRYSYIFAVIFVHIFVHPRLHSSVDAHICVAYILRFSGPSLALFSRWQRVHGYTSLIRPRFHSSLHSTSTFSEHFRDPGVYIRSTFYIYILRTFLYIWTIILLFHKHFSEHLWVLNNVISYGWTFLEHSQTF